MSATKKITYFFILILSQYGVITNSARILAIFPVPSYSHQVVFRELTVELSRRGHELVVFTPDPLNDPTLSNYTEVNLNFIYDIYHEIIHSINLREYTRLGLMLLHARGAGQVSDRVLSHPKIQSLISKNNTEKFDLLLAECYMFDAVFAISVPLNVPIACLSSLTLISSNSYRFGNPIASAYFPDAYAWHTEDMNIWQRVYNLYSSLRQIFGYRFLIVPTQEAVIRKHFNNSVPSSIEEISKNIAMMFVSSHLYFQYPRPNVPSILVRGYRWGNRMRNRDNRTESSLPPDLKELLDNSKNGFIYFSLGTNIITHDVLGPLCNRLIETFSELPYNVIWKYEHDTLPGKPDNVYIRKWWPQQAILAHPNLVVFIYQGGLQSTEEAIDLEVPVIGIPISYDQGDNVGRLESLNLAKTLSFDATKEEIRATISSVAQDPGYRERMRKYRDLLYDVPMNPLDEVVWWTEHVIRHKGAKHLYNKSRDLPWYTVELLDVFALLLIIFFAAIFVLYKTISLIAKFVTRMVRRDARKNESRKKNK